MPYIPPALRSNPKHKSRKIRLGQVIDYSNLKTKEQLFEEYRKENYGKADEAWGDNK